MVVKNQNKKQGKNVANNIKKKVEEKTITVESDDSEVSFDDMSDDEIKKMLGNSDNSDVESDDFSEEVEVESKEAKVNKKRKLESDDDEEDNLLVKKSKVDNDDEDSEDDEEDDEDDEEEEVDEEDSFIDDDEEMEDEEVDDEESVVVNKVEKEKVEKINVKEVKEKQKKLNEVEKPKVNVQTNEDNEEYRKIFLDTPKVEGETLRKEIKDRIVNRKTQTFVLLNLPYKFNMNMAKELIPDIVSIIVPYNVHRHQINGNAYVDVPSAELVAKYVSKLNGLKFKNKKITCLPMTKIDEDIDNYNCSRLAVSNLPVKATCESIKRILSKATDIKMMPVKKLDKKMTRVAFAEYSCVEDAIYDFDTRHGSMIDDLPVNLKFQSKSHTNIKKTISWDKKTLNTVGITKAMREDDMKKLFPQAKKITWTIGQQTALINYETVEECHVDLENAIKNKPNQSMKIFYKCINHNQKKESDTKVNKTDNKNFKDKDFKGKKDFQNNKDFKGKKDFQNNKDFKGKKDFQNNKDFKGKSEFTGKNEGKFAPKSDNNSKKPFSPNGKFEKKNFKDKSGLHGVKKTNGKPSNNKKFRNDDSIESAAKVIASCQLPKELATKKQMCEEARQVLDNLKSKTHGNTNIPKIETMAKNINMEKNKNLPNKVVVEPKIIKTTIIQKSQSEKKKLTQKVLENIKSKTHGNTNIPKMETVAKNINMEKKKNLHNKVVAEPKGINTTIIQKSPSENNKLMKEKTKSNINYNKKQEKKIKRALKKKLRKENKKKMLEQIKNRD